MLNPRLSGIGPPVGMSRCAVTIPASETPNSMASKVFLIWLFYLVVAAETAGLAKRNAGFAPARGRYFWAPALSTSATYRLPAESTLIPCTPQKPPGKFPHMPQAYMKLPFRSYLIIFD